MDIFNEYATDDKKEIEGVWVDLTDTAQLLLARMNNRKYARELSRVVEKNDKALNAKTEAADVLSESLMADVAAKTILLGWRGLRYKGADIEYTEANAKMLLSVKDFRKKVLQLADIMDNYKAEVEAAQVKS